MKEREEERRREKSGEREGGKRVTFFHFCVTQTLSKPLLIPESAKTNLCHSFYDLSDANVVTHSAEF